MRCHPDLIAGCDKQRIGTSTANGFCNYQFLQHIPMPSNSVFTSRRGTVVRWLAISFLTIVSTWLTVAFWWHTTQRLVSTADVLLHMVALPIGLLIGVAAFRRAFLMKNSRPRGRPDHSDEGATSPDLAADDDVQVRGAPIAVIGTWASTSLSSDGEALLEKLKKRRTRPAPDSFITDINGFPLLSGRVPGLDTRTVETDLTKAGAGTCDASDDFAPGARDALLRALALIDLLLARIAEDWHRQFTILCTPSDQQLQTMTLRGRPEKAEAPAGLLLDVKLILSSELDTLEIQSAQAYVAHRLSTYGISASQLTINAMASDDAPTAMHLADEFRTQSNLAPGSQTPQVLLLLSGVSNVCSSIAEEWESKGLTFSSQCPNGRMLGEAAFAVLCANETALDITSAAPVCHLTPVVGAKPSQAGKSKAKEDVLADTIAKALDAAKLASDVIGIVVCDADHRSDRTLESIRAMISLAPNLDAIHDRLSIDEACGHLGPASALGILAVGAIHAAQAPHPVLLFNVGHPTERAVAFLLPAGLREGDTSSQHQQAA